MNYYLGIDTSTTATKSLLIDESGKVVGVASSEYPYETPHPLWSEQHPDLWWKGTIESIRGVLVKTGVSANAVCGIGLTGQMHGLVLLGETGDVLRPAILWNDQRTGMECEHIREHFGKDKFIRITGNDALPGFTAPKILWVKNIEPDLFSKARHILLPKDFVRYKLSGEFATDKAGASGTVLFNLNQRDWSSEIIGELGINPELLPTTFEGPQVTGLLTSSAASQTGLRKDIPIVAGGGDQAAQAVGVGAVEPGIMAITLGTSGVVFASTDQASFDPEGRLHAFCHAVPERWHLMGVMLSAAGSLRWYRDKFTPEKDYDQLLLPASKVPAGSNGLLFLPYLTGERTPHPDPLARGAFVGLTVRHSQAHMTRAILEGVAFGLRDSFELMKSVGLTEISQVRVSGGGAKSSLWRQILADVMKVELATVNTTEGAAYGAALLAATGTGVFPDISTACHAAIQVTGRTLPGSDTQLYDLSYSLYRQLYPALRNSFASLTQIDK